MCPLYIDWKKSSFIDNSNKRNYWIDEEKTDAKVYYGSYYYKGAPIKPGTIVNEGVS